MTDPLSVAGSAVGIISLGIQVAQSLHDYYTSIQSQYSDITHTIRKLKSLQELLDRLKGQVQDRRFRADEKDLIKKIEDSITASEESIQELHDEAEKFKRTPVDSVRSALKKATRKAAYPIRRSTLEKLDEDVDDIVDQLKLALQLLQQEDIHRVQNNVEDIKALLQLVRSSQISSEVQDWLKAPDATINFNEACKKRHPRTGLWLVESPTFTSWLKTPNSFLWLRGFAGCGKSVLCSTAIQHTSRHRSSGLNIGVAFFFFTFNDEGKQDSSALLRALVLQLSAQLGSHTELTRLHESYRHATPPDEALLGCLHQLVKAFRDVYILVDALDESPQEEHRERMLEVLADIRVWEEPGLHLLVTSRDEVDIRDGLDAITEEIIEMKNLGVDRDIADFISQHLRKDLQLRKWEKYHDRIEKALTQKAKGVFRWVECQFKALVKCPRSEQYLEKLLQSLPDTLDGTYARMLRQIPAFAREYAQQLLQTLCCAIRPLTILELIDALAVEIGETGVFNKKRKLEDLEDIQKLCPGFTEVDQDDKTRQTTIRLAHFSVQEYLQSDRITNSQDIMAFHIKKQGSHIHMTRICLTLLLEPQVRQLGDPIKIEKEYPLAKYAARYWPEHLQQGSSDSRVKAQLLQLFQDTDEGFKSWVRIWNIDDSDGLTSTLTELLQEHNPYLRVVLISATLPEIINAKGGYYGTALQAAASGGHKEIVELLLEKGADVNIQGGGYGTALQAAASGGHKEIVELLLEKGAGVNIQGEYYGTALQAAASKGHKEIVELLLEKGADVNIQGGYYGTALQAAASEANKEMVELLLEKGADVNIHGGGYGTALGAAASGGHKDMVELLLEKGADVNIQGGYYGTALGAAALKGHKEIVELLLKKGADGRIALQAELL
ncbi:hypothetical protein SCUP234_05253 [Seiridium cupressi]